MSASNRPTTYALREGLQMIVMELVKEHGFDLDQIEQVLEDARWAAEDSLAALGRLHAREKRP